MPFLPPNQQCQSPEGISWQLYKFCNYISLAFVSNIRTMRCLQVDFVQDQTMVFCRVDEPTRMADLSEVDLPTRFVFLILSPENDGPGAIWEISEVGRSIGSMLGDQVRQVLIPVTAIHTGEMTSQSLRPRYDRHSVGITWHNAWS